MKHPFVLATLALWSISPLLAGAQQRPSLRARRVQVPIVVDGILDDTAWAEAEVATGFVQREPREGEPASEDTEVSVVYTSSTLYFGIRALDSEPNAIIAKEMERDGSLVNDDSVLLVLDTFLDGRNSYAGTVNLGLVEARSGVVGDPLAGLQQTHVTCRQTPKERWRRVRWLAELTRCRPTRNRLWMTAWAERNRCAWPGDLKRRICRSLCRVGWWETSARLFGVPCQGTWILRVRNPTGQLSFRPEALGAAQEVTNGLKHFEKRPR